VLRLLALGAAAVVSLPAPPATAAVRYGDAVPGIIKGSDLERIKRQLHLDRFSVIAAVHLGATEGREAVLAEPLTDAVLDRIKDACEAGGFCPDPVGFVASRIRIILLQDQDVVPIVTIEREIRADHRRLLDLQANGLEGTILGWNGRADAEAGHVALTLTPIIERRDGRVGAGVDPPFIVQWNDTAGRFQFYDCIVGDDGGTVCDFQPGPDE
jgi:hypothetical protein